MNTLSISIHWNHGAWLAFYTPWRTTRPQPVADEHGKPIPLRSEDKAKIAAYEALVAELNRVEAIHIDPDQVKPTPQFWEARSRLGKNRNAERALKEAMKEATT